MAMSKSLLGLLKGEEPAGGLLELMSRLQKMQESGDEEEVANFMSKCAMVFSLGIVRAHVRNARVRAEGAEGVSWYRRNRVRRIRRVAATAAADLALYEGIRHSCRSQAPACRQRWAGH